MVVTVVPHVCPNLSNEKAQPRSSPALCTPADTHPAPGRTCPGFLKVPVTSPHCSLLTPSCGSPALPEGARGPLTQAQRHTMGKPSGHLAGTIPKAELKNGPPHSFLLFSSRVPVFPLQLQAAGICLTAFSPDSPACSSLPSPPSYRWENRSLGNDR